jgi:lysophospholipase L1-like esterase
LTLTHRSKVIFTGALVLFVAISILMLAEGIVRVRQKVKYGFTEDIGTIYRIEPSSGLKLPIANKTMGGIKINSLGFRSPELISPKPDTIVRLDFLGGSTTFCAEASSNEHTWPHLVWEQVKKAKPNQQFDYLNAAVPGYTVKTSLKNLQKRVKYLDPDVIIIYHATNDLAADSRLFAVKQGLYQNAEKNRDLVSKYSLLLSLVKKNLLIRKRQEQAVDDLKLEFEPRELSAGFKKRLRRLVEESQKFAKLVAVVTFSHQIRREQDRAIQLKAANTALYYMPYMNIDGLLAGYEEYNKIIRAVTEDTGALLIEGEMDIPGNDTYFYDSVHFTDAGSVLMARRVSRALLGSAEFNAILKQKGELSASR